MAHSLTSPPANATTPMSARTKTNTNFPSSLKVKACHQVSDGPNKLVHRRAAGLGLAGAVLSFVVGDRSANAAARRPPPPPVDEKKEKKDPNVSGVLAKVLASKKRKEAMKEAVAKLREKGKPVQE
ncbi:hypothetical protein ACLB2K_004919 [Fragaria x ananassa]